MQSLIFVPLDGSPVAESVLPHAAALARATDSAMLLLRVVAPATVVLVAGQSGVATHSPAYVESTERALAEEYLRQQARQLIASGLVTHTDLCFEADPAAAILKRVRREPATKLIAMGTHARAGIERLLLGSVTEQVLSGAPCPVLVQRADRGRDDAQRAPSYRTIVVPLDRSTFAEHALSYAATLASATGATLVLVVVAAMVDDIGLAEGGIEPMWLLAECQEVEEQTTTYLGRIARRLAAKGIEVRTRLMNGQPSTAILQTCAEEQADLIVMATHGRRGLRRMVLGSVASGVIGAADQPVLLLGPGSLGARW